MEHENQLSRSDEASSFGRNDGQRHEVLELILTDYRTIRVEYLVTRSLFRVIWFSLCLYSCTAVIGDQPDYESVLIFSLSHYSELITLFVLGFFIFFVSSAVLAHIRRDSLSLTELLVSLDEHLKDVYVQEFYRNRPLIGSLSRLVSITKREDAVWLIALMSILYFQAFATYIRY